MGLVIQGAKRTVSGDRVLDYAAGESLLDALAHLAVLLDAPQDARILAPPAGARCSGGS